MRTSRANIGNAKVLGMATSLHLTPNQYNWALSIFFIGYVVFETPSNILLRKLSPRWYIPALTVRRTRYENQLRVEPYEYRLSGV